MAFLIVSSFGPLYSLTEGNVDRDGTDFIDDGSQQDTSGVLADVMMEDGFLLKPALNSTVGDRSTSNEIFAYQIESGDTLSSLAQRFGIKKETIVMENDLWNVSSLKVGRTLKILPVDGISHVIQKGDTLDKIAKKYNVDAKLIALQNQLKEDEKLPVDSALIIPGGKKEETAPTLYAKGNAGRGAGGKGGGGAPSDPSSYNYTGTTSGRLIWPTLHSAVLTQKFHRGHLALDIANRNRGPIFAAAAGKVIKAAYGWNGGYGNYVIIDHGGGMQTLYGHNEKLYVTEGQMVKQGDTIAWMGNTGNVHGKTGIHCHFEVRVNGVKYDPMKFF